MPEHPDAAAAPAVVLLVDDDPFRRELADALLTRAGFEVRAASGLADAFEQARSRRPDAILSDVLTGDADGFTSCRRFRRDPALRDVPVILTSAYVIGDDDRRLAAWAGAAALLERTPLCDAEIAALRRALEGGAPPCPDGAPLPDLCGRPRAACLSRLHDERRRVEQGYRTLLDQASDAIAITTPDGIVLDVNHRLEAVCRMPRARILGQHISRFVAAEHEGQIVSDYRQLVEGSGGRSVPVPFPQPGGAPIYLQFSVTTVETDGETVVFNVGRDVTEQLEANRRLAASERQYRFLVENTPDVVWLGTVDGTLLFVSPQSEAIFGFTPAELIAGSPALLFGRIHPEDAERIRRDYAALAHGQAFAAEFRWRRKDDQWRWLRLRARTSAADDGSLMVDGTCADVTDQKGLEEQVRQAQKMEALGKLTGGIAHDFNNLLAIILGSGHMVLDDLDADDPRRADTEAILDAGERAVSLTRQLLTFARRHVVQPAQIDLNEIVRRAEKMLRRVIGEDIDLSVHPAQYGGAIHADPGEIEQVIMNLALNARDAMPGGGALRIETSAADCDDEYARTHVDAAPGPYIVLSVTDTGCGMDAETQRRIFEPFFTTKGTGSTGLGLATCYGVVQRSGGHIVVHSEPGHGSTFQVYLPRVDAVAGRQTPASSSADTRRGAETILVVEDDELVRRTVTRVLSRCGYRVVGAAGGREAMALVETDGGTIDLIVSDVIMPGMSGPDLIEAVHEQQPRIRSLLMSGYTDHPTLHDGVAEGLNFIQKPFTPRTLAAKVREVLDG